MNELVKWVYRIIMLFLTITIIDININWRQVDPSAKLRLRSADAVLIGALVFLLITGRVIKKINKTKGGR